jgi:hypothetical protein
MGCEPLIITQDVPDEKGVVIHAHETGIKEINKIKRLQATKI